MVVDAVGVVALGVGVAAGAVVTAAELAAAGAVWPVAAETAGEALAEAPHPASAMTAASATSARRHG
jgi:hypothetical protein